MPCIITITEVKGTSPGPSIIVKGEAEECEKVKVRLVCTTGLPQEQTTVVVAGKWEADFPNAAEIGCACNNDYVVIAECVDNPSCAAKRGPERLECEGGECPSISFTKLIFGDCTDGTTPFTIEATLTGVGNFTAELRDSVNGLLDAGSAPLSPLVLQGTGNYSGTVTFDVKINSPSNCPGASLPISFPSCPECPSIILDYDIGGCDETGNRSVTVTAVLDSPDPYSAQLKDLNDVVLDEVPTQPSPPVSGQQTLSHSETLPGGTSKTYKVVINSPSGCSKSELTIDVPSCREGACCLPDGSCEEMTEEECRQRGGNYQGDGTLCADVQCGDHTICGSMVFIVGALFAVAMALTILTLAWSFCVPPPMGPAPTWAWIVVGAAWGLAAVAVITWYVICSILPDCTCPTECDWLQIGVMIALAGAAIASYLISCCMGLWWLVAVILGLAFIGALIAWIRQCRPSLCQVLAVFLVTLVSVATPAIAYITLTPLGACGSALVNSIIVAVGAILAFATAVSCAHS